MNHFQSGRARLTARVRATRISSTISSFSNPLHSIIEEKTGKTFDLAQQFHMLQASGKIVLTAYDHILTRCLKITEKVAFNIASEASYVYILRDKSSLKMPKMVNLASL